MRAFASCIAIVVCAACGQPTPPAGPTSPAATAAAPSTLNPARVDRVRSRLPAGYEFARLSDRSEPADFWGFGQGWTADPPPCAELAHPAGGAAARGWSASGPGGIVYAVVADASGALDPTLDDTCATWTLDSGPTTGVVTRETAPTIDGASTLGMAVDVTTTVEGGTETHSHADTFVAHLADHVAYVTVVTDPGASGTPLAPGVASDLLVQTVAAIRG